MGDRFEEPRAGQWVQPVVKGYKLACCDCGLVHTMQFRVHGGRIQFRCWRNNRSTATMRRWKNVKIVSESRPPSTDDR